MPRVSYSTWMTDFMFCTILFNCLNPLHYAYMQYVLQGEAAAAGRLANLETMSTDLKKKAKAKKVKAVDVADVDVPDSDSEEVTLLQALFRKLDMDSDGTLCVNELRIAFRFVGIYITSKQTQEVLEKVDDNKSGVLDFHEFVRLMFTLSTDWESYKPRVDFNSSFWSVPPSLQVDLVARYLYLPLYLLLVAIFAVLAATGAYETSVS